MVGYINLQTCGMSGSLGFLGSSANLLDYSLDKYNSFWLWTTLILSLKMNYSEIWKNYLTLKLAQR